MNITTTLICSSFNNPVNIYTRAEGRKRNKHVPYAQGRPAPSEKQQIRSLNKTRGDRWAEQTVSSPWNSTGAVWARSRRERRGLVFTPPFHTLSPLPRSKHAAPREEGEVPSAVRPGRSSPTAAPHPGDSCSASGRPPCCPHRSPSPGSTGTR